VVDCSSISIEASAAIRAALAAKGIAFLAAPVSGNAKVIKAGKLSVVSSGPRKVFEECEPFLRIFGPGGVSYVDEGELAGSRRSATTCSWASSRSRWRRSPCSPRRRVCHAARFSTS